jgi:hypothetical protein
MIRALTLTLTLATLTSSAIAAPAPGAQPSLGARALRGAGSLGGRALQKVGAFLKRQVQMRDEVKAHFVEAKALRKDGQLTAAAETLRDAPKAEGLRERFRAWRAKKAVMRSARSQLKVKRLDSDPGEGYAAMATLQEAGMTSWVDRVRANRAIAKGAINAVNVARRLGNKERFAEAADKLDWSISEREGIDASTAKVAHKLYTQAMKASYRASTRFTKAGTEAERQAAGDETLQALSMAQHFDQLQAHASGNSAFDGEQAMRIGRRLGLAPKQLEQILGAGEPAAEESGVENHQATASVAAPAAEPVAQHAAVEPPAQGELFAPPQAAQ